MRDPTKEEKEDQRGKRVTYPFYGPITTHQQKEKKYGSKIILSRLLRKTRTIKRGGLGLNQERTLILAEGRETHSIMKRGPRRLFAKGWGAGKKQKKRTGERGKCSLP